MIRSMLLFLIFLMNQSFAQTCTSTFEQEYQALMALYQATNGASWTNKTGWSTADPNVVQSVVGWYGVSVNSQGHVTVLNLHQNNLTGTIPTEIGLLTCLQDLTLNDNSQLTGNIPQEIGALVNLNRFWAQNDNLIGSIPGTIGNLQLLTSLDLSANHFSGNIPSGLGSLVNLTLLNLVSNQLSGAIPAELGQLVNIQHFYLAGNQLSGGIPPSLGSLINAQYLKLHQNQLSGPIPSELAQLQNLKQLVLSDNQLSGSIPSSVGSLSFLEYLILENNQLDGVIPASLGDLSNLKYLALNNNHLSGSIPSSLGNLFNLESLRLQHNELTGSIPATVDGLQKLTILDFLHNNLSGSIPSQLGSLSLLQRLLLAENALTGSIPPALGNLTNLLQLDLYSNQLTGQIPGEIRSLTSITQIDFGHNQLSGILPGLETLPNLVNLRISDNKLSGALTVNSSVMSLVEIGQNKFTFSQFLPALQNLQHISFYFNYQDSIDVKNAIVTGVIGQPLTLTTTIDQNTNPPSLYKWFKVINGITSIVEASPVGDGHTVTIPSITEADAGTKYYYTITNPAASSLTLTSHTQKLQIITCTLPTLDFASEELNGSHTFNPTFTGEGCTPTYTWDFGDGATSTEQAATHTYSETGTYTVTLTVSYTCGPCPSGQLTASHEVTIENGFCGSIYCDGAGGVGIGTRVTEGFRLSVNGKIRASDIIKVYPQNQWSDFVFEKDYKLRPLSEVEKFIKQNGHLPEIPSAKEVETEGIDLGGMDAKLLQKIEELTLYMIELKKENDNVKKDNQLLRKEMNELKKRLK